MSKSGPSLPAHGRVVICDAAAGRWLRFERPRQIVTVRRVAQVAEGLRRVEETVCQQGLYAAGFVSYEAAPAFDPSLVVRQGNGFPLLWFGLFEEVTDLGELPGAPASSRLRAFAPASRGSAFPPTVSRPEAGAPGWRASVNQSEFNRGIARIKSLIRGGDTYQVNYTYRLRARLASEPWDAFLQLAAAQDAPYGAYVDTGEWAVCSASPELFFRLDGQRIESRPMKGTAARGKTLTADRAQAAALPASEKERAENVMIVDMVRHDLGRIARIGSVKVSALCAVEKYPTLWQMTSTVQAKTRAGLSEIFQALFPPASVTGAPKVRTMEIIAELERQPRRLYTGTVGFFTPGRRAQFNVAIRTLLVNAATGAAEYGVGSGVTWDSDPDAEWKECHAKSEILYLASRRTAGRPGPQRARRDAARESSGGAGSQGQLALRPDKRGNPVTQSASVSLLETLRWTPEEGYYLLERHLARLRGSTRHFGFPLDLHLLRRELGRFAAGLGRKRWKIRLLVTRTGRVTLEREPLPRAAVRPPRVALACAPVDAADPFLYHKTTNRAVYEAARAARPGFDDVLLFNERGEVTESTIANVAVEVSGKLYTPPISCGLLAGTMRAELLRRGELIERRIIVAALRRATRIFLLNSVRGLYRVVLRTAPPGRASGRTSPGSRGVRYRSSKRRRNRHPPAGRGAQSPARRGLRALPV